MSFNMNIYLEADSLERLRAFDNYESALEPALLKAMESGVSMLQAKASDYMWGHFINPTGPTEDDSWDVPVIGPYETILANTAPQAQRLEFGFSGMTDSLGRHFSYWPDYHWAQQTVILQQYKIEDVFQAAIDYANLQLGRGTP